MITATQRKLLDTVCDDPVPLQPDVARQRIGEPRTALENAAAALQSYGYLHAEEPWRLRLGFYRRMRPPKKSHPGTVLPFQHFSRGAGHRKVEKVIPIRGLGPRPCRRSWTPKGRKGNTVPDLALCGQGLIDTDEHPGLILLQEANRFLGDQEHFHVAYPLAMLLKPLLAGRLSADDEEVIFATCLQSAWGVLLLLPHTLSTWIDPPHRWIPFLQAAARFWPILEAQGARYSYGLPYGNPLLDKMTTVDYLLTNSGIAPHHNRWEPYRRPPNWPALVEAYAAQQQSMRN